MIFSLMIIINNYNTELGTLSKRREVNVYTISPIIIKTVR